MFSEDSNGLSVTCKEGGCRYNSYEDHSNLHLHREIENLKQQVVERDSHIVKMESNLISHADKYPNGEFAALNEEVLVWQEKYERLYDAHKKLQKVNQNLEDKLLKIVDKFETEKGALTRDMANLTQRLVEARVQINHLQEENDRYKMDVNTAIQLLQCKPSSFVSQRIDSLPADIQQKVKLYINSKRRDGGNNPSSSPFSPASSGATGTHNHKHEAKTIKVPIPTFPPTAMVYSVNKLPAERDDDSSSTGGKNPKAVDIVSAAIMAKVLAEREKERGTQRHCVTCKCTVLGGGWVPGRHPSVRTNSHPPPPKIIPHSPPSITNFPRSISDSPPSFINSPRSISDSPPVVDKGTQTLPSYVGERTSTRCIYCSGVRNEKGRMQLRGKCTPSVHTNGAAYQPRSRTASASSSSDSQPVSASASPPRHNNNRWSRKGSVTSTETEI